MNDLNRAKIKAREKLNSLPPQTAQAIINRILSADRLQPNLSEEVDWDEIPIPPSLQLKDD
jgi:hypothetical protein